MESDKRKDEYAGKRERVRNRELLLNEKRGVGKLQQAMEGTGKRTRSFTGRHLIYRTHQRLKSLNKMASCNDKGLYSACT